MKYRIIKIIIVSSLALTVNILCVPKEENIKPSTDGAQISTRSSAGWDYPVKPGMESWNSLETEQERIAVLQVPEGILAALSPEEVVGLFIELPAFFLFAAFNTPQDGFDVMLSRYNVLQYLFSRNDIGGSLIAAYKDAGMDGFKTLPYSNDFWSIKLLYFELLLSQKEILQSMTSDEKMELITEARSKFVEKISNEIFSSLPGLFFSFKLMASILDVERYPELMASPNKGKITQLINTGWWFEDVPPIDEIYRITDNYINEKNEPVN